MKLNFQLSVRLIVCSLFWATTLFFCVAVSHADIVLNKVQEQWLSGRNGELEVLFGYEAPPNAYYSEDGRYIGFLVDILSEVESQLNFNFTHRNFSTWSELITYSKQNSGFVIVGVAKTEARSQYLSFTDPFIKIPYVIVTRKSSPLSSMDDLLDSKVCTVEKYAVNDYIANYYPKITITGVPSNINGLQAVSTGACDAMIINQMYASYLVESQGISNLHIAGESGYQNRLSVAVSIDDPQLFQIVEKALDQIDKSTIKNIFNQWVNINSLGLSHYLFIALLCVLAFVLLLFIALWYWNFSLQKLVKIKTKQLHESELKYKNVIDNSPTLLYQTDNKGRVTFASRSVERYIGYTVEEVMGMEIATSLYCDPKRRSELIQKLQMYGSVDNFEAELVRKDGSKFWASSNVRYLRSEFGEIVGAEGSARDITELKLNETALRESERKFREVFNLQFQYMAILSAEGRVLEVNELRVKQDRLRREDFIGQFFWLTPTWKNLPNWHSKMQRRLHEAARQKVPILNSDTYQQKDGTITNVDLAITAMFDSDGVLSGFIAQANDTTERCRTEEALRESEALFRTFFDSAQFGIAICRLVKNENNEPENFVHIKVNPATEKHLGFKPEYFVRNNATDIIRDELSGVLELCGRVVETGEPEQHEQYFSAFNKTVQIGAFQIDGDLFALTYIDVSDRKHSENELRKLAQAVEQSHESILITNTEPVIEYVNQSFLSNTGYSKEEVLGKNPRLLHSGDTPLESYVSMWSELKKGNTWKGELYNRRRDGSQYIDFAIISPIQQPDGTISHYVAVQEDITEKKKLALELDRYRHNLEEVVQKRTEQLAVARVTAEQANKAKSVFLAMMSHEVRTPMNGIIGMSQLALETDLSIEQRNYIRKVHSSAENLLVIINDILDFTKIESGKLELEDKPFLLQEVMDSLTSLLTEKARENAIKLKVRIDENASLGLCGDSLRLGQVLLNLAGNAVKFSHQGGLVDISVSLKEETADDVLLYFSVRDSGIGIAKDQRDQLFQPFTQLDDGAGSKYGGSGLGLSISKRLVDLMQGEIWFESKHRQGSTFSFSLRFRKNGTPQDSTNVGNLPDRIASIEDAKEQLRGCKVLLAEDNGINQELVIELLRRIGVTVVTANNGQEAYERVLTERFDGVLMDCQMPVMDGYKATAKIRAQPGYENLPILALTAYAMKGDHEKALQAGMNDQITKPIDAEVMFQVMAKWFV